MDIKLIKGIGDKTTSLLNKLNIFTTTDLVNYLPYRYDFIQKSDVSNLGQDDNIIIDGIVENYPNVFYINRKLDKMSFRLNTNNNIFNIQIFNRGFLKTKLLIGTKVTIIGKYDKLKNTIIASEILFLELTDKPMILPVYHLTNGITSKQINKIITNNISLEKINDILPNEISSKYNFINKEKAINIVHNPINNSELKKALDLLKYEELFIYMLKMNNLKNNIQKVTGLKRDIKKSQIEDFINKLPFELTIDQKKATYEIFDDLNSDIRMNRLVQGDVGSGKTIVSIIAIYMNYLSGYQSALMAPTEILAKQHFINLTNIFKDYNIKIELLTGKLKVSEKKKIYKRLKNNEIDILIGTHAIITNDIIYNNLGLVITDEQHRFGVAQRSNLKNKGITPDILYMSATPIPRTYALTIYGDMDVSNIKTMPAGRKEIITTLKKDDEIKEVLTSMLEVLKNNNQIYVVAPLVEESEKIELENSHELYEKMNKAFGKHYKVGLLHGKMKSLEKEEVMNRFKNNEIQILVSTTVIEVGIDVKNATMMVIFDANRFGLSTIHQLRGRVGRNDLQSYCILVTKKDTKRLQIMTKTSDGFKVSEEDFKLRGSGDLFGYKQSGDMIFKVADIKKDFDLLMQTKEDSSEFLSKNDLDNYPELNKYILKNDNVD